MLICNRIIIRQVNCPKRKQHFSVLSGTENRKEQITDSLRPPNCLIPSMGRRDYHSIRLHQYLEAKQNARDTKRNRIMLLMTKACEERENGVQLFHQVLDLPFVIL